MREREREKLSSLQFVKHSPVSLYNHIAAKKRQGKLQVMNSGLFNKGGIIIFVVVVVGFTMRSTLVSFAGLRNLLWSI